MSGSLSEQMRTALAKDDALRRAVPCDGPRDLEAYRAQYKHAREYWNRGGPKMARSVDIGIPGDGVDIPCRIHYPTTAVAAAKSSNDIPKMNRRIESVLDWIVVVPSIPDVHGWAVGRPST